MKFILTLIVIGFFVRWLFQNTRIHVMHHHVHQNKNDQKPNTQEGDVRIEGELPKPKTDQGGTYTTYEEIE